MNRRRFLAAVTGGLAVTAGCASNEPTDAAGPATDRSPETNPGTVYAGPAVTARAPEPSTDPEPAPTVVVASTESATVTPTTAVTTASDDGGALGGGDPSGGDGGGSGAAGSFEPTTSTATATPAESEQKSPLRLTLATLTMQRVAGELTCTAGPLAWMELEIEFLRGGEPVASERLSRDGPGTGDTLAFDVGSEEPDLDSVRLATAYAYPEP